MAAFIYRIQQTESTPASRQGTNKVFEDADKIADWARAAVSALNAQGIFEDIPGTSFNPQSPSNRANVASILYKWLADK